MKLKDNIPSTLQSASTSVSTSVSNRRWRQIAVIATYLGYLLMTLLWTPAKALGWGWLVVVSSLGFLAVMGYGLLMASQYGIMSNARQTVLDERQEGVRNRAYRVAYQLLAGLGGFTALYGYIATDSGRGWLPSTSNELQAVFWGFLLVSSTLPAAVLTWTEPEPVQEELPCHRVSEGL